MRITCPTCAAEYDVPGPIAPGRAVKCARCGSKWAPVAPLPLPVEEVALPPAPIALAPEPPRLAPTPLAVPVSEAPRRLPLLLAWVASLLVLAGLATAAVVWREPVMAAWPPSVRAYGALGLTAHP